MPVRRASQRRDQILLTKGKVALIDPDDYDRIACHNWMGRKNWNCWYAERSVKVGASGTTVAMHRAVMNAPKGVGVDHINGNGLDNRKANLRFANASQNQQNRHRLTLNTSGYRGVTYHKRESKWQAQIKHYGKNYYLGLHETREAAARAYDAKAKDLFGEFAQFNFPQGAA